MSTLLSLPDDILSRILSSLLFTRSLPEDISISHHTIIQTHVRALSNTASSAAALSLTCHRLRAIFLTLLQNLSLPRAPLPATLPLSELRHVHLPSANLLAILQSHCTSLKSLSFPAHGALANLNLSRALSSLCSGLISLRVTHCQHVDVRAVAGAPLWTLCALAISVENSYQSDDALAELWMTVDARKLRHLEISVSAYDSHATGDFLGDGLNSFRALVRQNLRLDTAVIGRLPVRALLLVHDAVCASAVRKVVLHRTDVWPKFMERLVEASDNALRELELDACRIEHKDLAEVLRVAAWRLTRYAGTGGGGFAEREQMNALNACVNLEFVDLVCGYHGAEPDVLQFVSRFAHKLKGIRVGGPEFNPEAAICAVGIARNATDVALSGVKVTALRLRQLLQCKQMLESLTFDVVENLPLTEMFDMLAMYAGQHLRKVTFPYVKMWYEFVKSCEEKQVRLQCNSIIDRLEQRTKVLDVVPIRQQLARLRFADDGRRARLLSYAY